MINTHIIPINTIHGSLKLVAEIVKAIDPTMLEYYI